MVQVGPGDHTGSTDGSDSTESSDNDSSGSGSNGGYDRRDRERDVVTDPPSGDSGDGGSGVDPSDIDEERDRARDTQAGGGGDISPDDDLPEDDSESGGGQTGGGQDISATERMRMLAAQRQADSGSYNPDNPYTPTGDTSGLEELVGEDLEPGRDYTVTGGDSFGVEYTDEYRRRRAAEQISQQTRSNPFGSGGQSPQMTGRQFSPSDIELTDEGARLTDRAQREWAADRFQSQGMDVSPGEVRIEDGRAVATEEAQERIAAQRIEERSGRQVIASAVGTAAGAVGVNTRGVDVSQTVDPELARSMSGLERGEDYFVNATDDGIQVETTESYRERRVAEQIGVPASIVDEGEDYERTDDGIELTAEGRRTAIEAQAVEEGEITTQRQSADVPGFGTIGGGEQTIDIQSPEQLEFDESGNLTGVSPAEYTDADIEASEDRLYDALGGGPIGFAAAKTAGYSRKGLDVAADVSTDLGQGFQDTVVDPVADVAGDVAEQQVTSRLGGLPFLKPDGDVGVVTGDPAEAQRDVFRAEEDEVTDTTAVESGTQKLTEGGLGIARAGIELPATAQAGVQAGGEAAQFAVENPIEDSAYAAGEATVRLGEDIAAETINNPIRTTGALVGSGAIFRGARAVGPRTSLAARGAIQPGEEILGYGGYGVTRRVAGQRAADRTFPQQEPLFFSEEAAIRAGKRVSGGLRTVGDRAASTGRSVARGAMSPGRLGVGLGGMELETDTSSRSGGSEVADMEGAMSPEPGVTPGNEGAGVDTSEPTAGGDPWPDYMLPEGHPMRSDVDAGTETTRGAQERLSEAQEPTTMDSTLTGTGSRLEMGIEQQQSPTTATDVVEQSAMDIEAAQSMDVRADTDLRMRTDAELDSLMESETRTAVDTELDTELESEQEQRLSQELRSEMETESETETESELELETELERELERRDRRRDEPATTAALESDTYLEEFEYGVASPGDVLTGDNT